jgi:hypothetical protein
MPEPVIFYWANSSAANQPMIQQLDPFGPTYPHLTAANLTRRQCTTPLASQTLICIVGKRLR